MDGARGTVKSVIFGKVRSGNNVIDLPKKIVDYAFQLVPSITSLYLPVEDIIEEPKEIARAPAIPVISKIHKVVRNYKGRNICFLEFFP